MIRPPRTKLTLLGLVAAIGAARADAGAPDPADDRYRTTVRSSDKRELGEERATGTVKKTDIDRRTPRSTPEALRYEAGVFVMQLSHGQAAAYIRGLTGQRTVLLFDGIRLNNSTWRPGPNQYFFTLDARAVESIEVLRGGGSTRFGSDALAGVINTTPIGPALNYDDIAVRPRLSLRGATADQERGGRAQIEIGASRGGVVAGFLGGVGVRSVGLLESAGSIENPNPTTAVGRWPQVPAFAADRRTQLGTGWKELTADGRLVLELGPRHAVTLAAYLYRQYDAPRTDQCPPPSASYDTCLTYEEQFRHLVYGAWTLRLGRAARELRFTISYQQQHERQRLDYPQLSTRYRGLDDVNTFGATARAATDRFTLGRSLDIKLRYGADTYVDTVSSSATLAFTDVPVPERALPRGQYLQGASYVYGGAWLDGELGIGRRISMHAGARLSWFAARAPADPEAAGRPVARAWVPVVGHVGAEWRVLPLLHLIANIDHSFRAPNLDDLTGRLQVGPGFQFENAALGPERSTTFEVGARVRRGGLVADVWVYEMLLHDAILKVPRGPTDCPPSAPQCPTSWSIFSLENAPALSEVRGFEGMVQAQVGLGLTARATMTYTWGEGPRVGTVPREPQVVLTGERIPLSRIPPLHGSVELWWQRQGFSIGAALRWAAPQDRLSLEDYKDARIPKYGTPGFAVVDLRASYRIAGKARLAGTVENVLDTPHRYHGSAVNGPARGVVFSLETDLY